MTVPSILRVARPLLLAVIPLLVGPSCTTYLVHRFVRGTEPPQEELLHGDPVRGRLSLDVEEGRVCRRYRFQGALAEDPQRILEIVLTEEDGERTCRIREVTEPVDGAIDAYLLVNDPGPSPIPGPDPWRVVVERHAEESRETGDRRHLVYLLVSCSFKSDYSRVIAATPEDLLEQAESWKSGRPSFGWVVRDRFPTICSWRSIPSPS